LKSNFQFFRFVSVGAIGTVLHYAILVFFVTVLNSDPAIGAMAGATAGAAFNYWLNHRFTFRSERPHKEALPRFLLIASVGVLLSGAIVKALTLATFNYMLSQVVATLTILILNFFLSKLWIFSQSR
jgi:putative flippase GtrA